MGLIKIASDGTIAGTTIKDNTTDATIEGVVSWSLETGVDGTTPIILCRLTVQPVIAMHDVSSITIEVAE